MFKKLLILGAVVLGLVYGSGSDLKSIKRSITGAASDNAGTLTARDNGGWGSGSGY